MFFDIILNTNIVIKRCVQSFFLALHAQLTDWFKVTNETDWLFSSQFADVIKSEMAAAETNLSYFVPDTAYETFGQVILFSLLFLKFKSQ